MRSRVVLAIALLLLVPSVLLAVSAPAEAAGVTAVATRMEGRYGPETWKDESPTFGEYARGFPIPPPPGYSGVYRNPYRDSARSHGGPTATGAWLGSSLVVTIDLNSTTSQPLDAQATYFIEAVLATAWGEVPAKLSKKGPTTFEAVLDLDGEPGKPWPNLLAPGRGGIHDLLVTVKRPASAPLSGEVDLGTSVIPVRTTAASVGVPGAATAFPQGSIPGYADLGAPVNLTTLRWAPLLPNETVNATFSFGVPHAPATVALWNGATSFTLFNGTTNGTGHASLSFDAQTVVPTGGGIVVLAGHLTGANQTFASAHHVLMVTTRAPRIVEIGLGGPVPDPRAPALLHATLRDPGATLQTGSKRATLVLFAGTDVLGTAEFAPATASAPEFRTAYFPPTVITSRGNLQSYEALAFLFDSQNKFYGFARATRGMSVQVAPVQGYPGERAYLQVQVTNLNDNHDGLRGAEGDSGLALTVKGEVSGLPGGRVRFEVTVDEGNTTVVEVPVQPTEPGAFSGLLNATSAELRIQAPVALSATPRPGVIESLLSRVPGPEPLLLVALLAVTALAGTRRARAR